MSQTVLVTDGEQRSALAVVRSLGRAGHRVIVASSRPRSLAGGSRYAARELLVPDPLADPARFTAAVAEAVRLEQVSAVLPVAEPSVLALLERREQLAPARLPYGDLEDFRRIADKALLLQLAPELGIQVPGQTELSAPGALGRPALEALAFPVVLKPARSVGGAGETRGKFGVSHAQDVNELERRIAAYPAAAYPLLLQQRVVGPGIGIFLLVWDGRTVATFAHRRLREKPPSGGVSVYRESIPADPALVARSRELLDRFRWQGVAMIEYKVDAVTGTPYLMEINGRFWGSLQLAVDAGVDFPRLLLELMSGGMPAPVTDYRAGVRSRWWWGDVDHLLARLTRSDARLALPPGSPSRFAAVLQFLRLWWPGDHNEVFRWGDPWPAVRETVAWFRR